ncbi:ribosomal protection-like ABC-F family protein [Desulfosporosinus sp. Sb-LF]|uniref:ribosomal protection-like ABC-F family protein n=1 Tax=Desulfosporosinus sp. Sb-LF TaxID=2560027 RepID=UPI00107F0D4A|nr:ABC-F type ribosomal protection protein [Desulfosporosinus sp. Sb-LF]TGE30991.1 ABC-F type ribosomal protection protein [Desulfosporosinus sp. Sb-LF]
MIECSINNLTKYFGANKLFHNISFDLKTGERIGLIGQNGCGKTTILKIIMGLEDYQEGEIAIRKDARVGYLNQMPVFEANATTLEVIELAFEPVFKLKQEIKALEDRLIHLQGEVLERAIQSYGLFTEQFETLGGYDIETKISKITEGLQITDLLKGMRFEQLSGGEKTRVILAKILLEQPDILLLDEPSNHLDLEAIEWLEDFLKEYKGSVLVVSHDRYFLDSVVNKIVELEFNRAVPYPGNYSYYVVEKERRFLVDYKMYQNQQKKIDNMERQIERYRIWGVMRDSDKMFKRAKELEKRLEKIETLDRPILEKRKVRMDAQAISRTGKMVLETEGLAKHFGDKLLLQDVKFDIFYRDSACIVGSNGSGKTTLLKMILRELEPDSGSIKIGSRVKIGYLPQTVSYEDEEQTVLEYFTKLYDLTLGEARSQLAKALFMKEDVNKKIKSLSGGEKSRLKLCSLTFDKVNFMILDEPTNHLDIDSREVLEETLIQFDGTLLFVSHDRYFINKVADKMIAIENKAINVYLGDYSYYLEENKKGIVRMSVVTPSIAPKEIKKKVTYQKPKRSNLAKKLELLEEKIEQYERKIKLIDGEMVDYSLDANRLNELFQEKEVLDKELEKCLEQWEALQE